MFTYRSKRALAATVLSILLLAALPVVSAFALDTGAVAPTTSTTGAGSAAWTTPENGYLSDNLYATAAANRVVSYSGFAFGLIPAGSTIDGIQVSVEGFTNTRQAAVDLSWDNGTTYTTLGTGAIQTTAFTALEGTHLLGGPTDKWGTSHTWTPADFAGSPNATFRVRLLSSATGTGAISLDQVKVTVFYTVPTFTLTYTAGANGSISGTSPQTVSYGADGTAVSAVPNTGYHFVDWSDASTANPRTDTNVTADVTVTANFAINTYTLTYTAGANGSITGTSPQTVNYGADGTAVTAVPDVGYHFVNWSDASTANPRTDTSVSADVTVTANFAINTFTLTYTAGSHGSITGTSPQTVNYGANGTAVTAVPNAGYHFVDWSDASTANPRTDTNVTANVTVTANFAADSFHLFDDVPVAGKEWMEPWIVAFYNNGITHGCGTNPLIYCPEANVTRAEMAVFVLRARHGAAYQPPAASHFFSDMPVAGKEWMEPWVDQYYREGMTNGCGLSPLVYCPEQNVTRAEMAVFLLRSLHGSSYVPPAATGVFVDVPVAGKEWMEPWIIQFYNEGITTGCNPSPLSYCPENNVTRAEMAVFIDRAYLLYP